MNQSTIKTSIRVAQISDCHLFSDPNALHYGANVYQHLSRVLTHLKNITEPDVIIFTGDLTQDHTDKSYENFVKLFIKKNITVPVYYLAGNHDEFSQLDSHLCEYPFQTSKVIENEAWQILLVQSKSETPSGFVTEHEINKLTDNIESTKKQLLMMHHHPIDVGYFIDKHGLINKESFWSVLDANASIQAIACGHIHQSLSLPISQTGYSIPLYTCPATSIQFDPTKQTSACNGQGAGYRIFELFDDGKLTTQTYFMSDVKQESHFD